ncbi:hypothetical protein [Duganella sp. HH101]|uniref:hypothetical protein n=1 Tax=Duganella sp. HH101 TaxID=1781066 RepID=UPI000893AE33|nr:hypothetical protein [Duganella sp. HH101]OEZ98323.1 hypothetical protein DUGA2_56280 [Duganella sp. HH101]OEZ98394.1 hypothetical protein DUGA2_56990 [Duganella sp. HH101]
MKIIDQRYLASDNRYSSQPCLLSILELDRDAPTPAAISALERRLQAILPGLRRQRNLVGKRCAEVPPLVQLVQQVAMELRRLAFNEVTLGFVGVVPHMRGRYRLVLPYSAKAAVAPALAMATQLVDRQLAGRAFNLQAGLTRLRALADRRSMPRNGKRAYLMQTARTILMSVMPSKTFSMPSIFKVSMPSSSAAASS